MATLVLRPTNERLYHTNQLAPPPRSATNPGGGNFLLRTQDVRNAAQLAHLAGRHERGQKLQFALPPASAFRSSSAGQACTTC